MALSGAQGERPVGRTFVSSDVLLSAAKSGVSVEARDVVVTEGYHHLTRVLRCRPGQVLEVFDGSGLVGRGRILVVGRDHLVVRMDAIWSVRESQPPTTLVCALLKAQAMDSVVRKVTELGINSLFVCATARSVPARHEKSAEKRLTRWQKIASEACLQCGRPIPTKIRFFTSWEDGLDVLDGVCLTQPAGQTIKALLHPGAETSMSQVLRGLSTPVSLAMAVGPEGGFTQQELRAGVSRGWLAVGVGPLVLRAETAAVVASAFMGHAAGRFDGTGGWRRADETTFEKVR